MSSAQLHQTLLAMLKLAGNEEELWPSTSAIANETGMSPRTVQRCIDELVRLGILVQKYPANTINPEFGEACEHDGSELPIRRPVTYVISSLEFREFVTGARPLLKAMYETLTWSTTPPFDPTTVN
jgi:biotin operon repressor